MRTELLRIPTAARQRAELVAGLLALLVCAVGCRQKPTGATRIPTFPVQGRLLIDGAPAAGAMVKFYSQQQSGRIATAIVREDGTFSASFYDNEDGAPAGEYKLLVVWMQTPPQGGLAQDCLGGRFLDPSKPVATITAMEGENRLDTIELKTGTTTGPNATR